MKDRRYFFKKKNTKKKAQDQNKHNPSVYHYKLGNRKIKLTVQKQEEYKKANLTSVVFYYSCVFCKKDFDQEAQACPDCGRPLAKINLRKCQQCGAKNLPARESCWVCNGAFPKLEVDTTKEIQTVLVLEADGRVYKSTDESLSQDIKKLFSDLVSSKFSKEALETWAKRRGLKDEYKKESIKEELGYLKQQHQQQDIIYILIVIGVIVAIILLIRVFWSIFSG
ncbi:hypothetical protein D4R78_02870 [bacterium]|nr:MAG: hypothetical protein D4R78_02870 [bacterium]